MKVLSDLHHFDLFHSFQRLFENRLGWELYRPIGLDWYDEGYWNLSRDREMAECILSTESGKCEGILNKYETLSGKDWAVMSLHLPRIGKILQDGEYYKIEDKSKENVWQNGVTLSSFSKNPFDIIISSVPQHFDLFEKLRLKYNPNAKHIFHMGPGGLNWKVPRMAKNLMLHSPPDNMPKDVNHVYYHQEFDREIFGKTSPHIRDAINCYVHFPQVMELWNSMNLAHSFKMISKTLGPLSEIDIVSKSLAQKIKDSTFSLHIKPGGESYGYILHNSFSIGRPVIINANEFKDKIGGRLLEDKVTCLDVSKYLPSELQKEIERFSKPDEHDAICERVQTRFTEVVDFDEEEYILRRFLKELR